MSMIFLFVNLLQVMFSTDGYAFPETYYLGTIVCHRYFIRWSKISSVPR
jgi:hypothetical protein